MQMRKTGSTHQSQRGISRRTALKGAAALGLAAHGGVAVTRLTSAQDDQPELKEGGTLRIAIIGEPPAVADAVFTTATVTNDIAQQMFEGLFAFDSKFNPQPMLVEEYDASEDGLAFTFTLRSGVKFHDGSELTSEDVVASLNRWGAINGRGKLIFGRMKSLEATDDLTVKMTFNEPSGVLLSYLALPEAMITPASVAEAAGEKQIPEDQLIGTGPFRFVEHQVDQYLRLGRYDDYAARSEEPDGLSGRRTPYLDEIEFIPVPEESVRANGLLTGDYHFADSLPPDFFDTLDMDPGVEPILVSPYFSYYVHFNKAVGLFTNPTLRKAVQRCFSQSEAMLAGFGREEFVRFNPSISGEETAWYSTAGADVYDQTDLDQARALLEEGGYNGETIRWMTTHEYPYNFKMADYIKQQMEAVGMKVELVVSDWATLIQNQPRPEAYEIFLTGHPQYKHPTAQVFNDPTFGGFWDSEAKDALVDQMIVESDPEKLQEIIDEYTALIWEEMPFVKCGDNFVLRGRRQDVAGYVNVPNFFFWNVGLE
jgi:peptide/nickel transport system substrate-binding protein